MPDTKIASYGSWKSPITSDLIVSETVRLSDIVLDDRDVFWVEMRPSEAGRNVIVRCTLSAAWVRTRTAPFVATVSALTSPSDISGSFDSRACPEISHNATAMTMPPDSSQDLY